MYLNLTQQELITKHIGVCRFIYNWDFFQHKLSNKLISKNQAVALESLNVKVLLKNHNLSQHIIDASWSSFVQKLKYKADWYGKNIIKIGRFDPSSKICHVCRYYNKDL